MSTLSCGARCAVVTLFVLCLAGTSTADELSELKERVAALEGAPDSTAASGTYLTKLGAMFQIYGFLRVDAVYDDSEMNDTEVPTRVLSESSGMRDDNDLSIYTRLTRVGLEFDGGQIAGAHVTGKLETDFYGFDSSDSRNDLRMRHAYLKVRLQDWELLGGQTIDLISPLYPSVTPDTLNWNVGNLGDRRPQVRLTYMPEVGSGRLFLQVAASQNGAIAAKNSDAPDGVLDGEDSGVPLMQGRVAYRGAFWNKEAAEVGVWGFKGQEEGDGDGFGRFQVSGIGADVSLPIIPERLYLKGEIWKGRNLADVRGGVAQGVNAAGNEIDAMGGWLEAKVVSKGLGNVFAGYSYDSPDREEVAQVTGVTNNSIAYAGVTLTKWNPVTMGIDYSHWRTRYRGAPGGENNRFRFYLMYKF